MDKALSEHLLGWAKVVKEAHGSTFIIAITPNRAITQSRRAMAVVTLDVKNELE
jgi:hypothetical protein